MLSIGAAMEEGIKIFRWRCVFDAFYLTGGLTGVPFGPAGNAVPGVTNGSPPAFCPSLEPVALSTGSRGFAGDVKRAATPLPSVAVKGGCAFSCAMDKDAHRTNIAAKTVTFIICSYRSCWNLQSGVFP